MTDNNGDALADYVEHFRARVAAEALMSAHAATWERRAEALELARPRPGDFRGRATDADLAARDARLAAQAQACRNRAAVSLLRERSAA